MARPNTATKSPQRVYHNLAAFLDGTQNGTLDQVIAEVEDLRRWLVAQKERGWCVEERDGRHVTLVRMPRKPWDRKEAR